MVFRDVWIWLDVKEPGAAFRAKFIVALEGVLRVKGSCASRERELPLHRIHACLHLRSGKQNSDVGQRSMATSSFSG